MIEKLKQLLLKGNQRSVKSKKNILLMLFFQGANMLIGLLLIPMTLGYVDNATYGIWLTLSTMITWVRVLDIGINHGLKNKLAQSLANDNNELSCRYVSTTYAMLTLIFLPIMLVLLILTPILNWRSLLNIPEVDPLVLNVSISIIIVYFCLNFILSTINVVLYADQRPADASFRTFVQQIASLIIIWILTMTTKGDLIKLCLGLCASPLLIVFVFNITLFRGRYIKIAPRLKSIDFSLVPSLMSLGIKFFIIQIGFIVQYQLSNILILRYFGAADVTVYSIAHRYFGVLHSVWQTTIVPIWVGVTDSIEKNDYAWIRNIIKKYTRFFGFFALLLLIMLAFSDFAYELWLGGRVQVPFELSLWTMLCNMVIWYGAIYINVLNGAGVLKVQTVSSVISPIVFLLSFFILKEIGIGIIAIPIACILSSFNGLLFAPIQCRLIFFKMTKKNNIFFK